MTSNTYRWPDGKRIAVGVTVMLETWSDGKAPPYGVQASPIKAGTVDLGGIAWGTPGVLAATAERAGAFGLTVHLLELLRDIDTIEDLRAEWHRLRPLLEKRKDLLVALESALGG